MNYFSRIAPLMLFPFLANAQNLCTNGGFESFTSLPNTYAQTCRASGWYSPSGTCNLVAGTGSPDYYHTGGSGGANPPNTWWATVSPHTGSAIMGFVTYYSSGNYREYIERQLSSPMIPGVQYTVSFWITNGVSANHRHGTNNIGLYFTLNSISQSLGSPIMATPQVERTSVFYSTTWQQMTFTYTPTQAFRYVTIGNFHNDAGTLLQIFGGSGSWGAYYFIDDIIIEPTLTLPVELTQFYGQQENNVNVLYWQTAAEINSHYFSIERSADGIHFDSIGRTYAKGNSTSLSDYTFTDLFPLEGINYYRLKQFDLDGTFEYTRIIQLKSYLRDFSLWPNPNTGKFTISTSSDKKFEIDILSVSGQQVYRAILQTGNKEIDITHLSKGVYIFKANNGESIYAEKILLH